LLESNTNRVVSQHEKLNKLLSDPNNCNKFQNQIKTTNEALEKVTALQRALSKMKNHWKEGNSKLKSPTEDFRNEADLKETYLTLYKLREELSKLKQKQ
jgi:hypothetical protein